MRSVRFQKGNLILRKWEQEATTWYHVKLILGIPGKERRGAGGEGGLLHGSVWRYPAGVGSNPLRKTLSDPRWPGSLRLLTSKGFVQHTLCPACRTASTSIWMPRVTGGWGVTIPSFHKTPNLRGLADGCAEPSGRARARYSSVTSWRKGIGTTAGSASHGRVERTDRNMRSSPPSEVLRKPIVDRYVFCPGFVLAVSR